MLGGMSWERIVRPAAIIIDSHLRDRKHEPEPEPEEEAEIVWGKASQFQWSASNPAFDQSDNILIIGDGGGDDDDEDETTKVIDYEEIPQDRVTEDIEITDGQASVTVRRILEIVFQGPNEGTKGQIEVFHRFILHHPAA